MGFNLSCPGWMSPGSAGVDLLLVFQATFADSTLVTSLVDGFNSRQFPPRSFSGLFLNHAPVAGCGLNSLCGINLAGHALSQRQQGYEYAYAQPDDPEVLMQIKALAGAGMLRRRLAQARVGVVGEHPDGMDSCHLDEAQLKETLGINVQRVPLEQVFSMSRQIPPEQVASVRAAAGHPP